MQTLDHLNLDEDAILFYDTETSGLPRNLPWDDESQPHCIQLGWILSTRQRILSEGNILLVPRCEEWEIHPKAQEVHGISKEMILEHGVRADIVALIFHDLAQGSVLRVCHNVKFDQKIMTILFKRTGLNADSLWQGTYCTMLESTDLLKLAGKYGKFKWPNLQELHNFCHGIGFEGGHDALADVRAMRTCFYVMHE